LVDLEDIQVIRSLHHIEIGNPRPAYPFYSANVYDWYPNQWGYDRDSKVIWKISTNFQSIIDLIEDYREKALFLLRRGRYFLTRNQLTAYLPNNQPPGASNAASLLSTFGILDSEHSKYSILRLIYESLEEHIDETAVNAMFFSLNQAYVIENNRSLLNKYSRNIALEQVDLDLIDELKIKFQVNVDSNNLFIGPSSNPSTVGSGVGGTVGDHSPNNPNNANGNFPAGNTNSSARPPMLSSMRKLSLSEKMFNRAAVQRQQSVANTAPNIMFLIEHQGVSNGGSANTDLEQLELYGQELSQSSQTFLSDISKIAIRVKEQLKYKNAATKAEASPSIAANKIKIFESNIEPVALTLRRNERGDLILTQSEILSYIWIPLLLSSEDADFFYLERILTNYISSLIDQGVEIISSLALLHLHLIYSLGEYEKLSNLLSNGFYSDSADIALTLLQFSTLLEEELSIVGNEQQSSSSSSKSHKQSNQRNRSGISGSVETKQLYIAMKKCRSISLQMLWRLNELVTIVKWYLTQGLVMEAMELCQQGMQSNGPDNDLRLLPSTVSGAEFFTATLNSFYSNNISTTTSSPSTSMKTTISSTRSAVESSGKKQEIHTERIRLLYAVYSFLKMWDKSILDKQPVSYLLYSLYLFALFALISNLPSFLCFIGFSHLSAS
jgi:hypothetical protein